MAANRTPPTALLRPLATAAFALAALVGERRASAQPRYGGDCAEVAIVVDAAVPATYRPRIDELWTTLRARTDVDRCATIALKRDGARVLAVVTLRDGRTASRAVAQPDDLVATLESLVLVPESARSEATETPAPSPPPAAPPPASPPPPVTRDVREPTAVVVTPPPEPSALPSFEAGLGGGARVGGRSAAHLGLGGELVALLAFTRATLGGSARIEQSEAVAANGAAFAVDVFAVGVSGGPRVSIGPAVLDLAAGPRIVVQRQSPTPDVVGMVQGRNGIVARMAITARLGMPLTRSVRAFAQIEGEGDVSHDEGNDEASALPLLPTWSAGLALGVMVMP